MQKKYDKNGTELNLLQDVDIESGDRYIKFPDGTLIQCGTVTCEPNVAVGTVKFKIPFVGLYYTTATHNWATESKGYCTIGRNTQISTDVLVYDYTNGITKIRGASVIAIGRWK